jgi:rhodanese-related sulfurtransferase
VRDLIAEGAQVVEVLPEPEYRDEHLPGAVNLPLRLLDEPRAARLICRERPIVVYCYDTQ